ncbi:MAG: NAD(P)/FAD-dependent oxidoreductase [Anaerolineae bacterium]|nr:NAD(P)/FAD-dependent oxidoreductase [Anaerolineae bacterium]
MTQRPRIVIVGAGFGGLHAAQALAGKDVDVLLIDRQNYHTFTPLLYQVATCALDPSDIAYPIRQIFSRKRNIHVLMGEVEQIDSDARTLTIQLEDRAIQEPYDYLIVAAGSVTNYFGNEAVEANGFPLKDLNDAIFLRNHILQQFETAVRREDEAERRALTTLVVVGGGPTGLETAGALHELYNDVLKNDFPELERAQVILIEATKTLLTPYPEKLQDSARDQLASLGVRVILNTSVTDVGESYVKLADGQEIATHTLIWAAGTKGAPLSERLNLPLQRGGRVPLRPTMEVVEREAIYVVGDMAYLEDDKGQPYPMLIPVAQQEGKLAAHNILRRIAGQDQETFTYHDRGIMATIGRSRAVAWIFNRISLTGYLAWVAWLFLHLLWLLGFRNRLSVLMNWVWNYLTYDRSVRLILPSKRPLAVEAEPIYADEHELVEESG